MAELIKVELIANPAVTRLMTPASFRNNQNKWRLAGTGPTTASSTVIAPISVEAPKKDVGPAAAEDSEFANPADVLNSDQSAPDSTPPAPPSLLEGLRAQYKAQFGKEADKRWTMSTLTKKINEPQSQEA